MGNTGKRVFNFLQDFKGVHNLQKIAKYCLDLVSMTKLGIKPFVRSEGGKLLAWPENVSKSEN
jgi:hypothetical protein